MRRKIDSLFGVLLGVLTAVLFAGTTPVHSGWLTSLLREAGEAGGKAARHADPNLGPAGKAASHLHQLPDGAKGAFAAHATAEGHWKFVNREGQAFTAANADEMKRVVSSLSPDAAAGDSKISLYLSEDSVFANRQHLDALPKDAELHVVTNHGAFPLARTGDVLKLQFKPNLTLDLADQGLFDETAAYLSRPLNKSGVRTIAIEPGGSSTLPAAPKIDAATKSALVDKLDPVHLNQAFGAIRGQTAVVVGRVDGGKVYFKPQSGGEISRDLDEILSAARQNDVNLVLLNAGNPLQPGGKNWLWQNIEIGGYNDAIAQRTFGDFLDALAARRAPMTVSATRETLGRVHISAAPVEGGGLLEPATSAFDEIIGHVTGEVASKAAELHVRDDASQQEIDARLIPWLPTYIQIPYLLGIAGGILGWQTSRSWWSRVWPPARRMEGQGRLSHAIKSIPNFLAYLLLFLPAAGGPAFLWDVMVKAWAMITAPFRWIGRLLRRKVEV